MGLFDWLSGNRRKQKCCLLTEDGRVLDLDLRVQDIGYVDDHKTEEAWGLISEARIPDEITGSPILVLTERDSGPLCLEGGSKPDMHKYCRQMKERMKEIAAEAEAKSRATIQKKSESNRLQETIQLLVIVLGIGVALLAILSRYMNQPQQSIFASGLTWMMLFRG